MPDRDARSRRSGPGPKRPGSVPASLQAALAIAALAVAGLVIGACTDGLPPTGAGDPSPHGTEARGVFHPVDGVASGAVALVGEIDGSRAVVLQDLTISSAADIDVIVVPRSDVSRDQDVDPGSIVDLGPLKGSSGMQDYWLPTNPARTSPIGAVVLWDVVGRRAIAAASLTRI